ncbi:Uncharacterised protein [Mycobacteroides abscessus subsp. abscessus]|nr:Uncharacterised protein [Mycobacteroides abscessus subsp. abscessus]
MPPSTYRLLRSTMMVESSWVNVSNALQCVVARRFLRNPALARSSAPVHTLATSSTRSVSF